MRFYLRRRGEPTPGDLHQLDLERYSFKSGWNRWWVQLLLAAIVIVILTLGSAPEHDAGVVDSAQLAAVLHARSSDPREPLRDTTPDQARATSTRSLPGPEGR